MATDNKLFTPNLVKQGLREAVVKLKPQLMIKNPVMFTVEIGTLVMLVVTVLSLINPDLGEGSFGYNLAITILLFLTVLFGNFAEALAEARGKAQAATLRKTREETTARRVNSDGSVQEVPSSQLNKGDIYLAEPGDIIPADGEIVEGLASIDESAITGESAPVIREADTDHSGVIGGTRVLSDRIKVMVSTQ
ncbi:MAG: potassium-transporting ATPase subunit B, partial [Rivularia sp. (in: cyanobacteria)]